jgi:hypothetical protein
MTVGADLVWVAVSAVRSASEQASDGTDSCIEGSAATG